MTNEKQPELEVGTLELDVKGNVVAEELKEPTPAEKKKAEKEAKKLKAYAQSMVTRQEAWQIAQKVATDEVGQLANFIRDPLRVNMIQSMALTELLIDKGIITNEDEFQVYLEKIASKVQAEAEGEASAQEESGNQEQSTNYPEEAEEQQS